MLAAITGFLSALPQLLSMVQGFMTWINQVSGNDPAGFAVKMGQAFSQLASAQTQEDHQNAAKALADLVAGMPAK